MGRRRRRMAAEAEMVGGVGGRDGGGEGAEGHAVEGEEDGQPTSHSVFVKNLSFSATEAQLKEHLEKLLRSKQAGADGKGPAVRSITSCNAALPSPTLHVNPRQIKKRVRNGTQLSMGFGFMEFGSVLAAHRAAGRGSLHTMHASSCSHFPFPSSSLSPSLLLFRHCLFPQPFESTKGDM
ncbi:unnamed protein product [Closterium sp. NIES-65]|nr:unnamed protein product [Closterium sp. NIES-65]